MWDFENELELVATLSDEAREAGSVLLKRHDELTAEIHRLTALGVSVDAISDATGLSPDEVRSRATSYKPVL